ncbi:hypothetical protein BDZ89DRAFT_1055973 [Hymenopellis radicata]|nr:hypothetical protein BDZ89DRAFT_1055973 [Hymenopellis radicata]
MSSESVDLSQLRRDARGQIRDTVTLVLQTLFYGIYVLLMVFFTYKRLKKGLNSSTSRLVFSMILSMFTLSTVSWASNFANFIQKIVIRYVRRVPDAERGRIFAFNTLINAIVLVNYFLTDGVVVWRAWVLCGQDVGYRWLLWIPISLLTCTTLSVLTTIVIRIVACMHPSLALERDINYSQSTALVLSLLTNILATSIIGLKAWKHRQGLKVAHIKISWGVKVLILLVESGLLYCISGIVVLIFGVVRLPVGTLGDVYMPVNVQIAGIYPIVVLLLVDYQDNHGGTVYMFENTQGEVTGVRQSRSRFESLRFASRGTTTVDSDVQSGSEV